MSIDSDYRKAAVCVYSELEVSHSRGGGELKFFDYTGMGRARVSFNSTATFITSALRGKRGKNSKTTLLTWVEAWV
jgi:hypothetical protein